jgi:hypothetical protein
MLQCPMLLPDSVMRSRYTGRHSGINILEWAEPVANQTTTYYAHDIGISVISLRHILAETGAEVLSDVRSRRFA